MFIGHGYLTHAMVGEEDVTDKRGLVWYQSHLEPDGRSLRSAEVFSMGFDIGFHEHVQAAASTNSS